MERINTASRSVDKHGEGKDGFQEEDLAEGIIATRLTASWFDSVQEEIANVVEDAGITLDADQRDQLLSAIDSKIRLGQGGSSREGIITADTSSRSGRPDFVEPFSGGIAIIAGPENPLTLSAGTTTETITDDGDILSSALPNPLSGSAWNFNIKTGEGGDLGQQDGQFGHLMFEDLPSGQLIIQDAGSEVTSRIGKIVAFSIGAGVGLEYITAKVHSSTLLTGVQRGHFRDIRGARIKDGRRNVGGPTAAATLLELILVSRDLTNGEFLGTPTKFITDSDSEPSIGQANDLWMNSTTGEWYRYSSTNSQYEKIDLVPLGHVVMNATTSIAARSFDLAKDYSTPCGVSSEFYFLPID